MGSRTAVALAIIVPIVGAPTWVSASEDHPDPIHACVERHSRQVRIVSPGDRCRPDESSVAWNVAGPQGPPGPAGLTAAPGPVGPQGAAGAVGPQGAAGTQGVPGSAGPAGAEGPAGATGPQGDPGPAGATGPQGDPGPAGATGASGSAGGTGPQGDPGPAGLQGDPGPTGAPGANGVSGWEYVVSAAVSLPTAGTKAAVARCPAGKQVFGGGFMSPGAGATVVESHPVFGPVGGNAGTNPGWVVWGRNPSGPDSTLTAYAICAIAS